MQKLTRADLYSLEEYAEQRAAFRAKVMAHKKCRRLPLGEHAVLYFEDRLTMQYQIQEMLRIERIFAAAEIEEELQTYNALIPDGTNWKATFMLEYSEVSVRREALGKLLGIEDSVWLSCAEHEAIYPIADEDMQRERDNKTSAVHFLRFELSPGMIAALKSGGSLHAGIGHDNYQYQCDVPAAIRTALIADLA